MGLTGEPDRLPGPLLPFSLGLLGACRVDNDALADILRKIAYALDLIRDPQDPNDLPKVTGYRLPTRNGLNCPFLNVALHDVDRPSRRSVSLSGANRKTFTRSSLPLLKWTQSAFCPP